MGQEQREDGINPDIVPNNMKNLIQMKHGTLKKVILYAFYKKPMANKASNRAKSAMPDQMKASMTSAEIQRRCRNCSRDLKP